VIDAITAKGIEQQQTLPRAKWGDKEEENQWRSKYLGSWFEAGGDQVRKDETYLGKQGDTSKAT